MELKSRKKHQGKGKNYATRIGPPIKFPPVLACENIYHNNTKRFSIIINLQKDQLASNKRSLRVQRDVTKAPKVWVQIRSTVQGKLLKT